MTPMSFKRGLVDVGVLGGARLSIDWVEFMLRMMRSIDIAPSNVSFLHCLVEKNTLFDSAGLCEYREIHWHIQSNQWW